MVVGFSRFINTRLVAAIEKQSAGIIHFSQRCRHVIYDDHSGFYAERLDKILTKTTHKYVVGWSCSISVAYLTICEGESGDGIISPQIFFFTQLIIVSTNPNLQFLNCAKSLGLIINTIIIN